MLKNYHYNVVMSLLANSFCLASRTKTLRLIINFVPGHYRPIFRDALNLPSTCRCSRQDGAVLSNYKPQPPKKAKPTKEVLA